MEKDYYALYLDDPAVPAFCSFSKLFVGTKGSLLKVADNFDRLGEYEKTAKAIRDFFAGNKRAKHNIAYIEIPVLEPVKFIKSHDSVMENIEWDHRNTWDFRYRMKADRVSISQILISYDFKFRRLIRAEFTGLCYEGLRGEWIEIDGGFWGHSSVFDKTELPSGKKIYKNILYTEEDESDALWELEQIMTDRDKIKFDSICDEIFADG